MATSGKQQREFKSLDKRLRRFGIDTSQFGFYDQPAFLKEERRNSSFLEDYARWVLLRPRDEAYDRHAREVVPKLVQILAAAFKKDSIEGGCVGASGMLTPMLNRLGIWSFGLSGSTILAVPKHNIVRGLYRLDTRAFPDAVLGHAWIVAPPFSIVDATIASQRWQGHQMRHFVPENLKVENEARKIIPTVHDMIGPDILEEHELRDGHIHPNLHHRYLPHLSGFNKDFNAFATTIGDLELRYCPTGVALADVPLEEIMSSGFRRSALDIWNQEVEPAFRP
jgi:hypothetical protein